MNKVVFFLLSVFVFGVTSAQDMGCCQMSATTEFSSLIADKDFKVSHQLPGDYKYNDELGEMIFFKSPDGKAARGFEIRTPYGGNNWLLIFHEWWGLNDYMKKEAAQFFKELRDVNILVVDLYDGKTATDREGAAKLMSSVDEDRARSIIEGAISRTGKKANIGTIGWCFGGGWSLQATIMAEKKATACVMYYGMPEKEVETLKTLECDVMGVFATKDNWITTELVENFEADMKAAGKTLTVNNYDEEHAFANPSNPQFSKGSAADARKKALDYLRKRYYEKG